MGGDHEADEDTPSKKSGKKKSSDKNQLLGCSKTGRRSNGCVLRRGKEHLSQGASWGRPDSYARLTKLLSRRHSDGNGTWKRGAVGEGGGTSSVDPTKNDVKLEPALVTITSVGRDEPGEKEKGIENASDVPFVRGSITSNKESPFETR